MAQAEGYELTDDELQQVVGAGDGYLVGGGVFGGMARSMSPGVLIAGRSTTIWIPKTLWIGAPIARPSLDRRRRFGARPSRVRADELLDAKIYLQTSAGLLIQT